MFHLLKAGALLYRVTDILRTWQDVVSGVGSYYTAGGRFNRVQQRTVYASQRPLVALAECAAHIALDRWQPRIGRGFLNIQPALIVAAPPLVSEHWLWCFKINVDMQLVDVEDPVARATFNHRLYELLNPSQAYRATAALADAIRLHPHPQVQNALADGILAPSVRTPSVRGRIPQQQVLFVPPNRLTIPATLVANWRMTLEFRDGVGQSVNANSRVIDWAKPWFHLRNNPAYPGVAPPFPAAIWRRFGVKYT